MMSTVDRPRSPRSYMLLSIAAALLTIGLKGGAYLLTGSVGLLSDAMESMINLVAALVAFWALTYAAKPADETHPFGHFKAEYFSSGVEGALILVAAVGIAIAAIDRLLHPQPLAAIGLGLVLSVIATAINGGVALILLQAGRRLRSITLRADAHHLLSDVWTTVGVIVGLGLVAVTGWLWLDPIIALLVAVNIIWTGLKLLRETGAGLLDSALPTPERQAIAQILTTYEQQGIQFHALRTRVAGAHRFAVVHVLVPGNWTVQRGHDVCEALELQILQALPGTYLTTHLEPLEDPASWADEQLQRR